MKTSKKIVLLGHFGVGKTSLIRRFVEDTFSDNYKVTIGVHILKKELSLDDHDINLIIWDLEGYDDIKKTRESYLMGTHGFIYVFDVTRPETYREVDKSITYLEEKFNTIPRKIVGNKADLVTKTFLKENKEAFIVRPDYFTSAKTGDHVEDLFVDLAKELIE